MKLKVIIFLKKRISTIRIVGTNSSNSLLGHRISCMKYIPHKDRKECTFPNGERLMKMLYLATEKIHNKWNCNYANWDLVINELAIVFEDALSNNT